MPRAQRMKTIATEITIKAPRSRVWDILTDFDAYPDWNPFLRKIAGRAEVGARLIVEIHLPGRSPMTFKPRVLAAAPDRELRWLGRVLFPGIFDGEHSFVLREAPAACLFLQAETFTGVLVALMSSKMFEAAEQGFVAMNQALKKRAEGKVI